MNVIWRSLALCFKRWALNWQTFVHHHVHPAPPPYDLVSQILRKPKDIAALYREFSQFPSLSSVSIGPEVTTQYGGKYSNIYTEWSQRDLDRSEQVKFCRQYIVFHDNNAVVYSGACGNGSEIKGELLSRESPSGTLKAVLRETKNSKGEDTQFLEIWERNRKVKSINLTALDKHGKVYEDEQFGCLSWSHSESHLLYIAERKRPKAESFFQATTGQLSTGASEEEEDGVNKPIKGDQFVLHEDWGEGLVNKSVPALCVLDIESGNISVLEGIPDHISPGQAFWSPGDTGVVFVGWWHSPFRVGLKYCANRRSALFFVDLTEGKCEMLSSDSSAVFSPRLSPDKCRIVYLKCNVYGPHQQCCQLVMYDWYTKVTSIVVDTVPRSIDGKFSGIYTSLLAPFCWSADSQRVIFSTAQRSQENLFVIDTSTGNVTQLFSKESSPGSWKLMAIDRDLLIVSFSSPSCPPTLKVGFLPSSGKEKEVTWISLEEETPIKDIEWSIKIHHPPQEQDNPQYPGLLFESILLKPKNASPESKIPLVVYPHGGPHSNFVSEWMLFPAVLCKMGFAVLLVNYRGSLGFGQDSILSLPGNIGDQDVKDVQLAVEQVLREDSIDPHKVALCGGSHGGFLSCHLIGQYPGFYIACISRNPVTNVPAMVGSTDIPDWCLVESGLPYSPETLPDPAQWGDMLNKSPIRSVSQVKTPVLLMLGEEDRRVPNKQGLEYYRALKAHGVPARLLWYPGNNHSLAKVDAESDCFMNIALWILKHMKQTC
ncbi:acylamino-acid-releasing enzyme isoform X1 [Xenopus laevis]|uniref:Acylamino-acid-releasing enzyme n=2 Tax=Xenopus laevis TaxID=8355 RepID=A0A8J1MXU3_XENLA|nr:acylamino-acid-releasing enzyme isoform X1 [Xenopus laevis]